MAPALLKLVGVGRVSVSCGVAKDEFVLLDIWKATSARSAVLGERGR